MRITGRPTLPVPLQRFPGLQSGKLARRRIYLDTACLTPTPAEVIDAIRDYYQQPPGCPLRNSSARSEDLEQRIRNARDDVRGYLNAKFSDEIVFTPNATFGMNLVSGAFLERPGNVLITDLEHNSNRLPWLRHPRIELPWPPGEPFPFERYVELLDSEDVKLVSVTALSNVTGQASPVRAIVDEAHRREIPVHIDAAQAFAAHMLDIEQDRPDFVSFSLHKAYGPTGIGGLYVRRDWRRRLNPTYAGAGTVDDHHDETFEWTEGAPRLEFGLQNYSAICAVPPAIALLRSIDCDALRNHYARLNQSLREELSRIDGIRFPGPPAADANHICSFSIDGIESLRLGSLLDMAGNIQVRAGKLCVHHWFHKYALSDVVRVSFGVHNTLGDVETYARTLEQLLKHYL